MKVTIIETSHQSWLDKHWKTVAVVSGVAIVVAVGALYMRKGERKDKKEKKTTKTEDFIESVQLVNESADQEVENKEQKAQELKDLGNKLFVVNKHKEAIEKYNKALELFGDSKEKVCGVFYCNRAACYYSLGEYDSGIADCNSAIECDGRYVKAYMRRALINEKMEQFQASLHDYTTACVLDSFKSQSMLEAAERVLKQLAARQANQLFNEKNIASRTELPSHTFISAFLNTFQYCYPSPLELPEATTDVQKQLRSAIQRYKSQEWEACYELVGKIVDQVFDDKFEQALAKNLFATFRFLCGQPKYAEELLLNVLDICKELPATSLVSDLWVNTLVKLANVSMDKGVVQANIESSSHYLLQAVSVNGDDADIYYHQAQLCILQGDEQAAKEQYAKALALYKTLPDGLIKYTPAQIYARIQKAVLSYKERSKSKAYRMFTNLEKEFPWCSDIFYYHGEMLLDDNQAEECLKCFEEAARLNPKAGMPILNQSIVYCHILNDIAKAQELTNLALAVEPKCDLAYMQNAQIYLSQGDITSAIQQYKKAVELSRSPLDAENSFMGLEAAVAQKVAIDRVGPPTM